MEGHLANFLSNDIEYGATINDELQLSDMIELYPPVSTPELQKHISAKQEFLELASSYTERLPPGRGKYFNHQKFYHRYLRNANDLLILDEPGTGKSCSVIGFTEYVIKEREKELANPGSGDPKVAHIRRIVILCKGDTHRDEIKNQIICRCSDGRYEKAVAKVEEAEPEEDEETRVSFGPKKTFAKRVKASTRGVDTDTVTQNRVTTTALKNVGYDITTYYKFAKKTNDTYPATPEGDEKLAAELADTIFWIDEAHNLLITEGEKSEERKTKEYIYKTIWRVFHTARRSKRIITTATPMINADEDIIPILNFVLPKNGVLPPGFDITTATDNDIRVLFPELEEDPEEIREFDPEDIAPFFVGQLPLKYNLADATIEDLEPHIRGRIGYIRAADTGAVPVEMGKIHGTTQKHKGVTYTSQSVLYKSNMSPFQDKAYQTARAMSTGYSTSLRQASNFVFPDGYWGEGKPAGTKQVQSKPIVSKAPLIQPSQKRLAEDFEEDIFGGVVAPKKTTKAAAAAATVPTGARAFSRYVTSTKAGSYKATPELAKILSTIKGIRTLSCKCAALVEAVNESPGNCFIYDEYDKAGAVITGLCLEAQGFVRYDESGSMFIGSGANVTKPYCTSSAAAVDRRVNPALVPHSKGGPLRYCILTGTTSRARRQSMMEIMNSKENMHGDYIKVMISSKVGREGINVNNVRQIHLLGPDWNQSAMYQAVFRGLRATSHNDLLEELKEQGKEPRLEVEIYRHCAITITDPKNSIDLRMYLRAEGKDREIRRVMRMLKRASIGCQVHYDRNVLPGVDGTAACDYAECVYSCVDPVPDYIDYSTYDVLYYQDELKDIVETMKILFKSVNSINLNDLAVVFPDARPKLLIMAMEELISNKVPLLDRFGYTTYLREDRGSFYLDQEYPKSNHGGNYAMAYYTRGLIALEKMSLADIAQQYYAEESLRIIAELETLDPYSEEFTKRLQALPVQGKASLVEDALIRDLRGNSSDFTKVILDTFKQWIHRMREPIEDMEEEAKLKGLKKGVKSKTVSEANIKKRFETQVQNIMERITQKKKKTGKGDYVYVHTIDTLAADQSSYKVSKKFTKVEGKLRLLKPNEEPLAWRDMTKVELPVYTAHLRLMIESATSKFDEQQIYGSVLGDKLFRIIDKRQEKEGTGKSGKYRGKECVDWPVPKLIELMLTLKMRLPKEAKTERVTPADTDKVIALLNVKIRKLEPDFMGWSWAKKVYYYNWYTASLNKGGKMKVIARGDMCRLIQEFFEQEGRLMK